MDADVSLTATFTQITYTLNVSATNGSVTSPTGGNPHTYNCSQNVSIVAAPANASCSFVNWTPDTGTIGNVTSNSTYIIMNGSYTIQANFNFSAPSGNPPATPINLSCVKVDDDTINLTWQDGGGDAPTMWDIRYSLSPISTNQSWENANQRADEPTPPTASCTLNDLADETTYYFAIKAGNGAGWSSGFASCGGCSTDDDTDRTTTTYNFATGAGTNKWAWDNGSFQSPFRNGSAAVTANYSAINSSNNVRWTTSKNVSGYLSNGHYNTQMYTFNITQSPSTIENISVTWEGYGDSRAGYDTDIRMWDYNAPGWVWLNGSLALSADANLSANTKTMNLNPLNFINASSRLTLVAEAQNYVAQGTSSGGCPMIFAWNGESYEYVDAATIGQILKRFSATTYESTNDLMPSNGYYDLMVFQPNLESAYLDNLGLWAVDHREGTEIIPDGTGTIHTISDPQPVTAMDNYGRDVTSVLETRDGYVWNPDISEKDFNDDSQFRDWIDITLPDAPKEGTAKLIVDADWGSLADIELWSYYVYILGSPNHEALMERAETDPNFMPYFDNLLWSCISFQVQVWNGSEWVYYSDLAGLGYKGDNIALINISDVKDGRIRLSVPSGSYKIDYVGVDYTADEPVSITEMQPVEATKYFSDSQGSSGYFATLSFLYDMDTNYIQTQNVLDEVSAEDGSATVLHIGDYINYKFDALDNPADGMTRTFVTPTDGYYLREGPEVPEDKSENWAMLEGFNYDPNAFFRWIYPRYVDWMWGTKTADCNQYDWNVIVEPPFPFDWGMDTTHRSLYTDYVEVVITSRADDRAPAAVGLTASDPQATSVELYWIAPGDDDIVGNASEYDIRYWTAGNSYLSGSTNCTGEPTPGTPGSPQHFTVTSLSTSTTYSFGIKTRDEANLWSALSDTPSVTTGTSSDSTAPGQITPTVADVAWNSIGLTWTAPADDGTTNASGPAFEYDIRYATSNITNDSQFNAASQCSGEPTPKYPGSTEFFRVTGLNETQTYYFAIKAKDEVSGQWSTIPASAPSAYTIQPALKVGDWWLWRIYYDDQGEGDVASHFSHNQGYQIENVDAVNYTVRMQGNQSSAEFNATNTAHTEWNMDYRLDKRQRVVVTGVSLAPEAINIFRDAETWVQASDATLFVRQDSEPEPIGTYLGAGDGRCDTYSYYTYKNTSADQTLPGGAPRSTDGYPFLVGDPAYDQYMYNYAQNLAGGDQHQYKNFRRVYNSSISNYDMSNMSNLSDTQGYGTYYVHLSSYNLTWSNPSVPTTKITYSWYSPQIQHMARKLDNVAYLGREDWVIMNYEVGNFSKSLSVTGAEVNGSTPQVSITITNNGYEPKSFKALLLIMNMNLSPSPSAKNGPIPNKNGTVVFPDMGNPYPAIKQTKVLLPSESQTLTWPSGFWTKPNDTNDYSIWCSGEGAWGYTVPATGKTAPP
jgi:hypothetical protein